MDAQQELFTKLKTDLETLGYSVYDGFLPPDGTPYPFVYLGDSNQSDGQTKTQVIGTVNQTIHVWSNNPKNRGTLSQMLAAIKHTCRSVERTQNFAWAVGDITQRIVPDDTTKTPLLHGLIEAEFRFT